MMNLYGHTQCTFNTLYPLHRIYSQSETKYRFVFFFFWVSMRHLRLNEALAQLCRHKVLQALCQAVGSQAAQDQKLLEGAQIHLPLTGDRLPAFTKTRKDMCHLGQTHRPEVCSDSPNTSKHSS